MQYSCNCHYIFYIKFIIYINGQYHPYISVDVHVHICGR